MKKLIIILALLLPFLAKGQDYRVIDWKTDVLNVQTINTDTFKFETEIKDYNDPGAITREIGSHFIDFVARCFKIIDSDATTITVVDLEHINLAPQSNKIGRVYQSIVDADSIFKSIGGVDISVLDDLSRWKDVARNNELFGRKIKDLDGRDTTGIYHINRQLLDSISPDDTTNWNRYQIETDTANIPDKDKYFWSAEKKWLPVTSSVANGASAPLYFTNINSEISGYKKASYTNDVAISTFSATASQDTVLVEEFLYDSGLGTSIIDAGVWSIRTFCKVSGAIAVSKIMYEVFVRDDADSILFSFYSDEINNTDFQYNDYSFVGNAINLQKTTYRLGIKVYFMTTSAAAITLDFRVGDGETTYANVPLALRHDQLRDKNGNPAYLHVNFQDTALINQLRRDSANFVTYSGNDRDLDMGANSINAKKITIQSIPIAINQSAESARFGTGNDLFDFTIKNNITDIGNGDIFLRGANSFNSRLTIGTGSPGGTLRLQVNDSSIVSLLDNRVGINNISPQYSLDNGGVTNSIDYYLNNTPLLLNTFKSGSLGGAGNLFYSTGASSQPASGSVNQVIGGNTLTANYVPKWDGNKFANSNITSTYEDVMIGSNIGGFDQNFYIYSDTPDKYIKFISAGNYSAFVNFGNQDMIFQNTGVGAIDFYTNNILAGNISANQNWGIGKSATLEKFDINGNLIADVLKSRVPTGTPPLVVASTTVVDSLNAGLLDGKKASDFQLAGNYTKTYSGTKNYLAKITGADSLGNSGLSDNGTIIESSRILRGLAGFQTYGSNLVSTSGYNTSGGVDEKWWYPMQYSGSKLISYITNDAVNAFTTYQEVKRSGNTIESICFPNGVFGFGKTNPSSSYRIDVTGAVNSTGGFFKNGVEITGGSGSTVYPINSGIVTFNGTTWGTSITNNSNLWNNTYDKKIVSAAFSGTSTKTLTLYQQDGNVLQAAFTDESGGTTNWSTDTYGLYYTAGKVGVGANSDVNTWLNVGSLTSTNIGVYGKSQTNPGVRGSSVDYTGVFGSSTDLYGVYGVSTNGYGGGFDKGINLPSGNLDIQGQTRISQGGFFQPVSSSDASAPNNSIYYSTTQSKLVYKNASGTVNVLY